jgi:hypothetical protein
MIGREMERICTSENEKEWLRLCQQGVRLDRGERFWTNLLGVIFVL